MDNKPKIINIAKRINQVINRPIVKNISIAVLFLFTITILGYLVYRDRNTLLSYKWQIHFYAIFPIIILYVLDLMIVVWIWVKIVEILGNQLNYWQHFRYVSITNIAKRLPGTIWYIFGRGKIYEKNGFSLKMISVGSGIEIVVSIIGGIIVCAGFGIPILKRYPIAIAVLIALLIINLIFINPRVFEWGLGKFGIQVSGIKFRNLFQWIVIYSIAWILGGGILFSIINMFFPVGFDHLAYVIGCWAFVGVLSNITFFLPTNMGLNEIGISLLLSTFMPSSIAVVIAVVTRIMILALDIAIALICWIVERGINHQ